MSVRRTNPRRAVTYTGQSSRARSSRAKPKPPIVLPDPETVAQALEQTVQDLAVKKPADSRWAHRDRTVPAGKWSGKP